MEQIRVIRSRRKTLGLEIRNAQIIVRIPLWCTDRELRKFLDSHSGWIEKHLEKSRQQLRSASEEGRITDEQIRELTEKASRVIPERVRHYAPLVQVSYGKVTIRHQKTRWGSCSAKGNLNFNCLLMLCPEQVLDSVVVHELCHRKYMDHSKAFYAEVLRVFPEYHKWNKWLKENGPALMKRMC